MADVLIAGFPEGIVAALAQRLGGARIRRCASVEEAMDALAEGRWSLLVIDHAAPGATEALRRLRERSGAPPVLCAVEPGTGADAAHRLVDTLGVSRLLFHPLDVDEVARQVAGLTGAAGEGDPRSLAAAVTALWDRFRGATFRRVEAVEEAVAALREGRLGPEERRQAEREAHKLAGSVGTFGFAEGSRIAREMEGLLEGSLPLEPADTLRLSELAVALRRELERPPPSPAPEPGPRAEGGASLLVYSEDEDFAGRVVMEAEGRSLRARAVRRGEDAGEALAGGAPRAVLLDLAGRGEDGLRFLRETASLAPSARVLVLTGEDSFTERLQVARLGADAFLQKPISPARAVDAVLGTLQRTDLSERRVLAVDDDPQVLGALRALLEPSGIELTPLDDPLGFWDTLESVRPDLVVLDIDMPYVSGVELCRVVRNEPRWSTLPVLFLTARSDPETIRRVFAAGADDYVAKPFVGPELVTRIENRLERIRLHRLLAETDALTGIANRAHSEEGIARFLRLALRHREPVSLAVVDLDRFKQINDRWGHAAGDEALRRLGRVLQRSFRAEDVVGRWGGDEFVIGMYGTDKEDGVQRLTGVLEQLREDEISAGGGSFRVCFTAGVAEFPGDGADLAALYRAADGALYQAKGAGRGRVLPAGWSDGDPQRVESVDVAVVEDDETLAGLLVHALETRGYRTQWVREGQGAVDVLCGARPALRARVVLLDLDLPGRDGLGVLQALAREGVLERSRVVMLTVRAGEREVLRALELGAFDHVAKPFSVPVLLQRIGRALENG